MSAMSLRHLRSLLALAAWAFILLAPGVASAQARTTATLAVPDGTVTLSLSSQVATCAFSSADFFDPNRFAPHFPMPTTVTPARGPLSFRVEGCGVGQPVTFTVEFPSPLSRGAQWWSYGNTPQSAGWHPFPATVAGNRISFTLVDGGNGDEDTSADGAISHIAMLVVLPANYQDLWWGGSAQSGWGVSVIQHRDMLFANVFVFDPQGNPVWYVMPSGAWNATHLSFTGALYRPKGAPYYAYDASRFDPGAAVGTLSITLIDWDTATLDYTINGAHSSATMTRVLFGPPADVPVDPHGDLWWAGSAQDGWGLALLQQNSTLFALWFTYDANGQPTWFVMPNGGWQATNDWRGPIFKATGSPGIGAGYDLTRLHLDIVGTFDLKFGGENTATFSYFIDGRSGSIPVTRVPF